MCLTVNGKDIMESENLKLLDVTIDCDLNFNVHISNVCKKASQRIGVIMRLRNLIPTEAQLHIEEGRVQRRASTSMSKGSTPATRRKT